MSRASRFAHPRAEASDRFAGRPGACSAVLPAVLAALALVATAAPLPATQATAPAAAPVVAPAVTPLRFESQHEVSSGGRPFKVRAAAATTVVRDAKGEPEAEFFSFSYFAAEGGPPEQRPVTFAFNGGPGSSSIWLHLGLLGPKLAQVPSDAANAGAPPFPLVDNAHSLLDLTDVVMVDPIGTGFSRVVGAGKEADHWGFDEDARSVARFIRQWLTDHGRHASPKYLLGESYGGIRSALLVRELQAGSSAIALNGVMLVSPALDMELIDGQENDACHATQLPTFAAVAWYHHALPERRPERLEPFLDEVARFVEREYVPALFLGRDLLEPQRQALTAKLYQYTGIAPDYWERAELKVSSDRFRRELLRRVGQSVGRLDGRYLVAEADGVGELPSGDALDAGISGAYVACFNDWMQRHLGVKVDREYQVSSPSAGGAWKRPAESWPAFQGYVDTAPVLARGMAENPALRVFIANGYFDLATTWFAAEHNVRRSTMDSKRVTMRHYPAGHMMYVHHPTLTALAGDLRDFLRPPRR